MNLVEAIREIAAGIPAGFTEDKGKLVLEFVVAERKAFLSRKKLVYRAQCRVDEAAKELRFTELLKETGFGLSSGSGEGGDFGTGPGFGFKKETYQTGLGAREGTIEEQSSLFGKQYTYRFDFTSIRGQIEAKAGEAGYRFVYKLTGFGL
jgi:hypothetical protein